MQDFTEALYTAAALIVHLDLELREIVLLSLGVSLTAAVCAFVLGSPLWYGVELPSWLAATAIGATLGSWLGVKHLPPEVLRYLLSALLLVGGVWMLVSSTR
jgi:tungstate transport system permease protein